MEDLLTELDVCCHNFDVECIKRIYLMHLRVIRHKNENKMKVLHVYRTCYPETKGGVEQVIRFIASGTKPLGIETKILTLSDNQTSSYYCEGTEIISVKNRLKSLQMDSRGS